MAAAEPLTWLASFPKSGNTWLRLFLSAYLDEPAEDDVLLPFHTNIAGRRWAIDELLGIDTADLTAEETRALLPRAFRAWFASGAPRIIKTHDAFGHTSAREPLFPPDVTRGVVHLVRDPRDVVVSWQHHLGHASIDRTIERLNDSAAWLASKVQEQVPQFVSDWSSHTRSWLGSPLPRLTLRYEDMLADPTLAFRLVLAFCAIEVDEVRLARAVAATSFARLQQQERAHGFAERLAGATAPFFREGRAGSWRTTLTQTQIAAIERAHGPMMDELGYAR